MSFPKRGAPGILGNRPPPRTGLLPNPREGAPRFQGRGMPNRFGPPRPRFGQNGGPHGLMPRGFRPRFDGPPRGPRPRNAFTWHKDQSPREQPKAEDKTSAVKTETSTAVKIEKEIDPNLKKKEQEKVSEGKDSIKVEDIPKKTESTKVALDDYNCDLHFNIDESGLIGSTLHAGGFEYLWGGARATHGARRGKVAFECTVLDALSVDVPDTERNAHVLRVGWSIDGADFQLGEDQLSYGFGGTGKISVNSKFSDYGRPFSVGDVLTCCLDLDARPKAMLYLLNGEYLGVAFRIGPELGDKALFPHVTIKNMKCELNFGGQWPKYPITPGFTMLQNALPSEIVKATTGPATRHDAEVIMMVGLPACGKTFWAENYCKEHPDKRYYMLGTNNIIDKMRIMGLTRKRNYHGRWDALIKQASGCLNIWLKIAERRVRNYILDQTNVYFTARRRKMNNFREYKRIACVIVNENNILTERTKKAEREEGKSVPEEAVMEMKANFTLPEVGESFVEVMFPEEKPPRASELVASYSEHGKAFKRNGNLPSNQQASAAKMPRMESSGNHYRENSYQQRGPSGGHGARPLPDRGDYQRSGMYRQDSGDRQSHERQRDGDRRGRDYDQRGQDSTPLERRREFDQRSRDFGRDDSQKWGRNDDHRKSNDDDQRPRNTNQRDGRNDRGGRKWDHRDNQGDQYGERRVALDKHTDAYPDSRTADRNRFVDTANIKQEPLQFYTQQPKVAGEYDSNTFNRDRLQHQMYQHEGGIQRERPGSFDNYQARGQERVKEENKTSSVVSQGQSQHQGVPWYESGSFSTESQRESYPPVDRKLQSQSLQAYDRKFSAQPYSANQSTMNNPSRGYPSSQADKPHRDTLPQGYSRGDTQSYANSSSQSYNSQQTYKQELSSDPIGYNLGYSSQSNVHESGNSYGSQQNNPYNGAQSSSNQQPPSYAGAQIESIKPAYSYTGTQSGLNKPAYSYTGAQSGSDRPAYSNTGAQSGSDKPAYSYTETQSGLNKPAYSYTGAQSGSDRPAYSNTGTQSGLNKPAYSYTGAQSGSDRPAYSNTGAQSGSDKAAYSYSGPQSGSDRPAYSNTGAQSGSDKPAYSYTGAQSGSYQQTYPYTGGSSGSNTQANTQTHPRSQYEEQTSSHKTSQSASQAYGQAVAQYYSQAYSSQGGTVTQAQQSQYTNYSTTNTPSYNAQQQYSRYTR